MRKQHLAGERDEQAPAVGQAGLAETREGGGVRCPRGADEGGKRPLPRGRPRRERAQLLGELPEAGSE